MGLITSPHPGRVAMLSSPPRPGAVEVEPHAVAMFTLPNPGAEGIGLALAALAAVLVARRR